MNESKRFDRDDGAQRPGSVNLPRSIIDWLISDDDRDPDSSDDGDDELASAGQCPARPPSC